MTEGLSGPLPTYADLAAGEHGGPPGTSWGVFGDGDEVGAVNLLTADRLAAAARLVVRGARFPLDLELSQPDPPLFGRTTYRHTIKHEPNGTDDSYDGFYPQASSQWDALCHVGHPEWGFYNGVSEAEIQAGPDGRLGIDRLAGRGIAGRFVLLDLAGLRERQGRPVRQHERDAFAVADLDAACAEQAVEVTPGTVLLLHTGWLSWYRAQDRATREAMARQVPNDDLSQDAASMPSSPGLECDESVAAWLWDHGVAAVAADNIGVEALPFSRASVQTWLHYRLIAMLGIPLGELWDLDALARDCRADGRWEGLLVASPLHALGGAGSPANAMAMK